MFVTSLILAVLGVVPLSPEPPLLKPLPSITTEVAAIEEPKFRFATSSEVDYKDHVAVADPNIYCSCVLYVRSLGAQVHGNAINVIPTHFEPAEGNIAIMRYPGNVGHVAIVTKVEDDGFWITEANYRSCKKTERFIPNGYKRLIGFTS